MHMVPSRHSNPLACVLISLVKLRSVANASLLTYVLNTLAEVAIKSATGGRITLSKTG